jgi:hypothetical protein
MLLIVSVPEDEGVATTYFGVGAVPEATRPRLGINSERAK